VRTIAAAIAVIVLAAAFGLLYAERALLQQSNIFEHLGRAHVTDEWRGYVIVPHGDRYRIVAPMDGHVWLAVDGRPLIDPSMGRPEARLDLLRGLHPFHIRHVDPVGEQGLDVRWSRGYATPSGISAVLFVPDVVPWQEVQRRILIARLAPFALPTLSLLLFVAAAVTASAFARRLFAGQHRRMTTASIILLAFAFGVFATGMWWGLPDDGGWAVDEITPGEIAAAVESRFSGGWATIYPPFHYAVLTALTAPFHIAAAFGMADISDVRVATQMFLITRGLSVLMGVGIVVLVFCHAGEIGGRRAAFFAAATVATALPLTYYAKTANVDVPTIFWLTLSLLFYSRAFAHGRPSDFYLFTVAGVAAICTKDQTYGYFVLPAAYMTIAAVMHHGRSYPGVPPIRVLARMAALAAGGLVLLYNIPFNPSGFAEHVRIITGPGSQNYRMYSGTPSGQIRLLGTTLWELGQAMGWPMFAASVCGVVSAVRERNEPIRWLILPVVSYYVTLIAVVGYHYDRFFLGTIVVFGIAAGWWIDRWTRDDVPMRTLRMAAVALAVVYGAGRVLALDAMMVRDSRYAVENWLVEHAAPQDRIAAVGFSVYLPRASKVFWNRLDETVAALEAEQPHFVVVNAAYSQRGGSGSHARALYDSLSSGSAGYERVLRYRTRLPWSPLNWEPRFSREWEDEFSNLTKINPPIEVFRRIR